jgi:hypothetical protein
MVVLRAWGTGNGNALISFALLDDVPRKADFIDSCNLGRVKGYPLMVEVVDDWKCGQWSTDE